MHRPGWHRVLALAAIVPLALLLALTGTAFGARGQGQTPPPEPTEPQISIFWPPLVVMNWGIPSEHLHLKLNQPSTPETLPVHICLPGAGAVAVLPWFHLIWKPDGIQPGLGMFSDIKDFVDKIEQIGDDAENSGGSDSDKEEYAKEKLQALLAALPGIGTVGVPMPRDQLGDYELEVFCIEILPEPPFVKLGRSSSAYSVEPYAYADYVLSRPDAVPYEGVQWGLLPANPNEDHAGPVSYWRMGDLPKGSRVLTDAVGGHNGTYYADGGVHPALDRDGAPNCNVFDRATSGCNDGTIPGSTSSSAPLGFTASTGTDVFSAPGHAFKDGQYVRLTGISDPAVTGVENGALDEGPYYFVVNSDTAAGTFQLAADNRGGSPPIDLGPNGSPVTFTGSVVADTQTVVNSGIDSDPVIDHDRATFFTPGQYAAVQDYPAAEFTSGYTIETWVNPHVVQDMGIFQHGRGPALRIEDGRFVFRQTDTDIVQASGDYPEAGKWFHVVGTWDGAGDAKLYVNGETVGNSSTATGVPSGGGSTLYIGRDEISPDTFNGAMDEIAYYTEPLKHAAVALHHEIATYVQPAQSLINPLEWYLDVTRPKIEMKVPTEGAVFNSAKSVDLDFDVTDPDGDVSLGNPGGDIVAQLNACLPPKGSPLNMSPGSHTLTVVCTDRGLNVKSATVHYSVGGYPSVVMNDDPVGYWRLGEPGDSSVMQGYGTLPSGEYKNDTAGGPEGISGDADATRSFLGAGGYGYVNGIEHPRWSYTMEGWVKLADSGDAMIMQHGRGGALFVHDGRIVFRQTVTDVVSGTLASTLADGRFHQVVGVWDGVFARLFIDGRQEGDEVYAPTPPSGFSTFYVGYGEYAPWLRGDMDEVSYYGTALTPERVMQHFLADPPAAGRHSGGTRPVHRLPRTTITRSGVTHVRGTGPRLVATLPLVAHCPRGVKHGCRVIATLRRTYGSRALVGATAHTVRAGRQWRVQVRLTAPASRLLRAAHHMKARASVKVRATGAQPAARTATLTLRR